MRRDALAEQVEADQHAARLEPARGLDGFGRRLAGNEAAREARRVRMAVASRPGVSDRSARREQVKQRLRRACPASVRGGPPLWSPAQQVIESSARSSGAACGRGRDSRWLSGTIAERRIKLLDALFDRASRALGTAPRLAPRAAEHVRDAPATRASRSRRVADGRIAEATMRGRQHFVEQADAFADDMRRTRGRRAASDDRRRRPKSARRSRRTRGCDSRPRSRPSRPARG